MHIKKYYNLAKHELFPICRSITGRGARKTLQIIKNQFSELKIHNVPSGSKVFDWKIPSQWDVYDAYVMDKNKKKIIDFKNHNLHIVGYSTPVKKIINKINLLRRIHSLKNKPKAIPYINSYYKKYWGFCTTEKIKNEIKNKYNNKDKFYVLIKSKFKNNGVLNYGELVIRGKSSQEILISTYICHPSMANNELSGIIVAMSLINFYKKKKPSKTLRFVFVPETIGSITYINKNLNHLKSNVIGGYNLSCLGDERQYSCILSKYRNSPSDYSLLETYSKLKIKYKEYSYLTRGSDERQYNSPGVELGITSIFRTKYEEYPEYHTSLDNFDIVTKKGLSGGFRVAKNAINILDKKIIPQNKLLCEPFMSKRKLYPTLSSSKISQIKNIKLLDFLTYADGKNDLLKISKYIKLNYKETIKIYKFLKKIKLLK